MATPALKALSNALGVDRLSLLALKPGITDMAQASGLFQNVFTWDPDSEGLDKGFSLLNSLRGKKFTHSLALFPTSHWKFTVFHRLIGADFRMGFAYPNQSAPEWVQHRSLPLTDTHDTVQNLRLVEAFLGAHTKNPVDPFFPQTPKTPAGIPSTPFFTCHPGSSAERGMAEKRLPPEHFSFLIQRVYRETGMHCVLVGGPEEKELRTVVAAGCPEAITHVDMRSLVETAGVLQASKFFLGNDSGLMHLADAVGMRCVAFFGPTDEKRTGPFGYWQHINGSPRHLILRREGKPPVWTLETVGSNPPLKNGSASWNLDLDDTWGKLNGWITAL